jgi:hypothetical protein
MFSLQFIHLASDGLCCGQAIDFFNTNEYNTTSSIKIGNNNIVCILVKATLRRTEEIRKLTEISRANEN